MVRWRAQNELGRAFPDLRDEPRTVSESGRKSAAVPCRVAAAGAAAGIVGLEAVHALVLTASSAPIRVGIIIGVRAWGRTFTSEVLQQPGVEVAALCDVDSSVLVWGPVGVWRAVLAVAEDRFRLPAALDDPGIDALLVATPDHWHGQITTEACAAGKDVYVEAPIGQTIDEVRRVSAAAPRSGASCRSVCSSGGVGETFSRRRCGDPERCHRPGPIARAWVVHRPQADRVEGRGGRSQGG